jgi:hypothetical protein
MYHHSIDKRGLVGGAFKEGAFVKTVRIMIEAVNSALQNASLLRASAEQTSAAESFAANPARVQKVAPRGPSLSIFVDVNYDTAVLQYRNVETRDVIDQIPSETLLQARAVMKPVVLRRIVRLHSREPKCKRRFRHSHSRHRRRQRHQRRHRPLRLKLRLRHRAQVRPHRSRLRRSVPPRRLATPMRASAPFLFTPDLMRSSL